MVHIKMQYNYLDEPIVCDVCFIVKLAKYETSLHQSVTILCKLYHNR